MTTAIHPICDAIGNLSAAAVAQRMSTHEYTVLDVNGYHDGWCAVLATEVEALRMAVAYQGSKGRTSVKQGPGGWVCHLREWKRSNG